MEIIREDGFRLIGEPAARPDGVEVIMWETNRGDVCVSTLSAAFYDRREVETLGMGNFLRGAYMIGQAYYNAPPEQFLAGSTNLLSDKIGQLKLLDN